ncbi:MAG: NlpC/P60 family protein, partial [Hyphomicrobiales bacterium]
MRQQIVGTARGWIGTPYHHQASVRGVGCDCLGLVRVVYREVLGHEPASPPPYTPDWAEALGRETLLDAAGTHLHEIPASDAGPGDVLVFRMRAHAVAKHIGILSGRGRMIHAYSGRDVVEVHLGPWWYRH